MSNDSDGSGCVIVVLLVATLCWLVFMIGARVGKDYGYYVHQKKAVEAKHADWIVNPDGTTTFQWKPL